VDKIKMQKKVVAPLLPYGLKLKLKREFWIREYIFSVCFLLRLDIIL